MDLNKRMPRVDSSQFSMVPRADIPRSTFVTTSQYKTTFHTGYLVPVLVKEILPADAIRGDVTIFARLATPVAPIMDHMRLETFFFFVANRLVYENWVKLMGERKNPGDSISYLVPWIESPAGGFPHNSIWDYMGLPCTGQITAGQVINVCAFPLRAYNLIWNEWFRDQNLQTALPVETDDGPDNQNLYALKRRNKRHDYFTSALTSPLKGGVEVGIPLGGTAPITGLSTHTAGVPTAGNPVIYSDSAHNVATGWGGYYQTTSAGSVVIRSEYISGVWRPAVYADLSTATGATINALRLAFQTQRLLERDNRGGTRYTELLKSHFSVTPQDTRLQRPEYIGGGRTSLQTQAIPQTSATGLTGGDTPLGGLGAAATASDQHSFSYNATEHGFIIGLVHVTGEITYQQGLHRQWTRSTRYDFYWPAFAHLGEQAIRNDELYATGVDATDIAVFGYQERWAEYRHEQSRITGNFKSYHPAPIDHWHLAQYFTSQPVLNSAFIQDIPPFERVIGAGAEADNQQILFDSVWKMKQTRALPMWSVPGQIDRF